MRLLLDLQACQTASRLRGIGRYVNSLARAMLALRGSGADIAVAVDAACPAQAAEIVAGLHDLLPSTGFRSYHYPPPTSGGGDPAAADRGVASQLIARSHAAFQPDAVLQGSLFEGFFEGIVTCEHTADIPGAVSATILYDLIPLLFPDRYLTIPGMREWYFHKLQVLKNCDLLLAISEASRRDAIERLSIPAERIRVIHGAADPVFRRLDLPCEALAAAVRRFGIRKKYILYTGNSDFRKNTSGAIEAFARLPDHLRREYQLVLNQAHDSEISPERLQQSGLTVDEVIVTGHVSDDDLVTLLNGCATFLFPSLYEGFGLPVLEAMACGAPVIGGDNSSIREIIREPSARFDAGDPTAIAASLGRVLGDADFRRCCVETGYARAQDFSWERSAHLALDALAEAVERKQAGFRTAGAARRRIAFFTPLPPERTGIAAYSTELLPELAKHFRIDIYSTVERCDDVHLTANFRIRPWQEFAARADVYDGVIYQIGNSPFHTHMFDLLEEHPGVVVLHDFFLSSAYSWLDRHGGRPGAFADILGYCHGEPALRLLREDGGFEAAKRLYPCNRRVLERSLGVVSHSTGNVQMRTRYGCTGVAGPYRVVPHIRVLPALQDPVDRSRLRSRLGFAEDDWVLCSFGFIADTKLSHELIRAFASSPLAHDPHAHLVLVGELDGGTYGQSIRERMRESGLAGRIRVTGFVDDATYRDYLAAADAAAQLRAHSRGETSGAVLDCLAHGLPVIVNAHGTMRDYPEDVLRRIADPVDSGELAEALQDLHGNPHDAAALGTRARAYIGLAHAPSAVALGYRAAVEEFLERSAYSSAAALAADAACAFDGEPPAPKALEALAQSLGRNGAGNAKPALVVDLSEVVQIDYGTGIHRVVRNLARELIAGEGDTGFCCVPACLDGESYRVAADYARTHLGALGFRAGAKVRFAPGDVLLMLDSAWSAPERFLPVFREAEAAGAEVVGYVYDLIPLLHPETCTPDMPTVFRAWLEHTVRTSHAIVCISRATADDLVAWIERESVPHRRGLRIHFAHLGSDFDAEIRSEPDPGFREALGRRQSSVFLMVGTIEPRKGHATVLDAFEPLWAEGLDATLCIIGKPGWKMEPFAERMRAHPEFARRLIWREKASDADIDYAYRHARALVQASRAEGYGLPLIEAARHGTPVLCSDIPVFREIGIDGARYFPADCADSIAGAVRDLLRDRAYRKPSPARVRTWKDAASDLVRVLGAHPAYRVV